MSLSEVSGISGKAGDFQVTIKEHPRYVDMEKCIACGQCAAECPKKVDSEYDAAVGKRTAIYVKNAQAVPDSRAIAAIVATQGKYSRTKSR